MDASELMRLMASLQYLWFFCDDSQATELDSFADALEKIEHEPFIIFAERLTQPEDSSGDLLQEEEEDSPARMRRLLARVENSSDDGVSVTVTTRTWREGAGPCARQRPVPRLPVAILSCRAPAVWEMVAVGQAHHPPAVALDRFEQ